MIFTNVKEKEKKKKKKRLVAAFQKGHIGGIHAKDVKTTLKKKNAAFARSSTKMERNMEKWKKRGREGGGERN